MRRPLVALDVGSTKVACAIGLPHESSSGFELLGSSVLNYPMPLDAWLSDPLLVSRTIEEALEATAVTGDVHHALVAISHPALKSERVRVAVTLGDEPVTVRAHDLERLQRMALDQVLGVDREPLLVDRLHCAGNGFEGVRDPRGLAATRLLGTFHVVTMPLAARRALVQAVESAGLEVARLVYTLPALLASGVGEESPSQRVLLIDVGGLMTDVGLFADGVLQAAETVPWGGRRLAATLATALQATADQAARWAVEGMTCRNSEAKALIVGQWEQLRAPMERVLSEQPRPDLIVVSGRGALMDGLVEWVERTAGSHARLARSGRLQRIGDLAKQVGLSAAIGLLEMSTRSVRAPSARPARFFPRLLSHARTILTEYF